MEALKWFTEAVIHQTTSALGIVIGYSILFSLAGLSAGILLIIIGNRNKLFKRAFNLWSYFAWLHYLYWPLLLLFFGGVTGGFYGANKVISRFINSAAEPLSTYALSYASQFEDFLPDMQWVRENDRTLEEVIAQGMAEKGGVEAGSMAHKMASMLNLTIVQFGLEKLGVPELAQDPAAAIQALKAATSQANFFSSMTGRLHSSCSQYIWMHYQAALLLALPFLLLPLGEILLHLAIQQISRRLTRRTG